MSTYSAPSPTPTCDPSRLHCNVSNDSELHNKIGPYVGYVIQSILFGLANCLVVATIIKHPNLRFKKEYVMVALLAFADVINEVAFLIGGCYRIRLIAKGEDEDCMSPFECIKLPQGILWSFSFPLVYFMLLAVTIDRFICVLMPVRYRTYSLKFTFLLAALFYILAICNCALAVHLSNEWSTSHPCDKYEALCLYDHMVGNDSVYYTSTSIQVACSAISVILYACIPLIYHRQVRKLSKLTFSAELNFLREQSRLLVTLGIGAVFTFALMVLMGVFRILTHKFKFMEPFPVAGLVMNMNPIVNTFLFIFRHQRFRASFKALITCKSHVDDTEQIAFFRNGSVLFVEQQSHSYNQNGSVATVCESF